MRQSAIDLSSECSTAERAAIKRAIETLHPGGRFLEVGTAAGGTLKEIIQTADAAELGAAFYVLDPFTYYPRQLEKVHENLENSGIDPARVTFWVGTTDNHHLQAVRAELEFDFIFIDGDHRAYPVMNDLRWMDRLTVGGVACFHDYAARFPGVVWSLDHFLARNPEFEVVERSETLVVIRRNGILARPVGALALLHSKLMQTHFRLRRSLRKRLGGGQS